MELRWIVGQAGNSKLRIEGEYVGSLVFDGREKVWCWCDTGYIHNLGTHDAEEAKALAVAIWSFNK